MNSCCKSPVTWVKSLTPATMTTMTSPNAVVNNHAACTTDFVDSGAWQKMSHCHYTWYNIRHTKPNKLPCLYDEHRWLYQQSLCIHCDSVQLYQLWQREFCPFHEVIIPLFSHMSLHSVSTYWYQHCAAAAAVAPTEIDSSSSSSINTLCFRKYSHPFTFEKTWLNIL